MGAKKLLCGTASFMYSICFQFIMHQLFTLCLVVNFDSTFWQVEVNGKK